MPDHAPGVENSDTVDDHVGDGFVMRLNPDAGTTRPEFRNGRQRFTSQQGKQEILQRCRRSRATGSHLHFQPGGMSREFQLPQDAVVFGPATERHSQPGQSEINGIEVGGGKQARRKRLTRKMGQAKRVARLELDFSLRSLPKNAFHNVKRLRVCKQKE